MAFDPVLKRPDKRAAYLDLGGQCWYVLGCDAKGRPIGMADEIPVECGVMLCADGQLDVLRPAPKWPCRELPFGVCMALARATPIREMEMLGDETLDQSVKIRASKFTAYWCH